MAIRTRFAELLAAKGKAEGREVSLYEVAHATGVQWSTVKRWAAGEVARFDAPTLEAFCLYFACDVGDLLFYAKGRK